MQYEKDDILVKIDENVMEEVLTLNISRNLEELCATFDAKFSFNLAENDLPFGVHSLIQIYCNTHKIFTGYIEEMSTVVSQNDYSISISGREIACDFVDSTVGANGYFKSPVTLAQIVRRLLDANNMKFIKVIDRINTGPFSSSDIIQSDPTETCYGLAEKYSKKKRVFLMGDGSGAIIIDRPNNNPYTYAVSLPTTTSSMLPKYFTDQYPISLMDNGSINNIDLDKLDTYIPSIIVDKENIINNAVIGATFTYDTQDRFNLYRSRNQYNPTTGENLKKKLQTKIPSIVDQVVDEDIRKSRILDQTFDSINLVQDTADRLEWDKSYRIANSRSYSCTLPGWSPPESFQPWKPNSLVRVRDEFLRFEDDLLIGHVTFNFAMGDISTQLELKSPDAYEVEIPESKFIKSKKGKKKRKRKGEDPDKLANLQFFNDVARGLNTSASRGLPDRSTGNFFDTIGKK